MAHPVFTTGPCDKQTLEFLRQRREDAKAALTEATDQKLADTLRKRKLDALRLCSANQIEAELNRRHQNGSCQDK